MTLDQLEMIEAIVTEGSYQAAAKKLHKSQPSLSNGVKKIETFYGIEIFSRDGYRPKLTQAGRKFFECAKTTLRSYRDLHNVASELGKGRESMLTVSIDPVVSMHRIETFLQQVLDPSYKPTMTFQSGVLFDNFYKLKSAEVDFAIGLLPQIDNEEVESKKLCQINLVPVIGQKLLGNKKLSKSLLLELPNLVVQTDFDSESHLSISDGLKWFVDSHARKTELILQGFGWGRISSLQLKEATHLIQIPKKLVAPIDLDIYFMRCKSYPHGPIASALWEEF